MAAALAIEIFLMIKLEIRIPIDGVFVWSDSTIVLFCIKTRLGDFSDLLLAGLQIFIKHRRQINGFMSRLM